MPSDVTLPLNVMGFQGAGTTVKAGFPIYEVAAAFGERLQKDWAKAVRKLSSTAQVAIQGEFVRVDEGNRWARYLVSHFLGQAIVEVEGRVIVDGREASSFHFVQKTGYGLLGGNSRGMVLQCARQAASRVVKTAAADTRKYLAGGVPGPLADTAGPRHARTQRQWQAFAEDALTNGGAMEQLEATVAADGYTADVARSTVRAARAAAHKVANNMLMGGIALLAVAALFLAGGLSMGGSSPSSSGDDWVGAVIGFGVVGALLFAMGLVRKLKLK